ncbi:dTMP kinase [Methanocaldococcus indicus]|uniref:dTMP kinase n=1 Tax=Methanocaldococcus indicus TaxID=213231 RepID=UPI003C6CCEAA
MFIVFEGIDGSGKTTISKMLANHLGYFWTAEPTDGEIGKFIREILTKNKNIDSKAITLLFTADRYEHQKIIKENIKKGVICDRYFFSTLAYQSVLGVEDEFIKYINKDIIMPDVVFLLVVDVDEAIKRLKTSDLFEKKSFLEKVQKKYLELAKEYNFIVIDTSNKSIDNVFNEILKRLEL